MVEAAWARPDDFVFRYAGGKQPMETELRLDLDGRAATLRNAFGETMIGLRAAYGSAPGAGFEVADGTGGTHRVRLASGGRAGEIVWAKGKGDGAGNIRILADPGVEIAELLAFPAGASFHLRPGSCGDTCRDLHLPGVSLIPDRKWRLAGDFGRNHRTELAGGKLQAVVPGTGGSYRLVLLVEALPGAAVELRRQSPPGPAKRLKPGKLRRLSISLRPGNHQFLFTGPVALVDAWLTPR